MKNIAVKTNTVCKGFGAGESRTEVLKEVNFEARMGELLMLVGPSGCGKTTLLSIIAGTLGVDRGEGLGSLNPTRPAHRPQICSIGRSTDADSGSNPTRYRVTASRVWASAIFRGTPSPWRGRDGCLPRVSRCPGW